MKNVFLFTGADGYSLDQALGFWKKNFIEKHGELNLSVLDGLNASEQEIWTAVTTLPFLGEKRLVIVQDLPVSTSARSSEALQKKEEYLAEKVDNVPDETILAFVSPAPDKRRKFAKKLLKEAEIKDYPELKGAQLSEWIRKECARKNVQMSNPVVSRLAEMVGGDLWQMSQEIDKLAKFSDGEEVELTDLDVLVRGKLQDNIFKLTDAMGQRDVRKMLGLFQNLVDGGESPQQILYMLVRQLKLLCMARSIIDEGKQSEAQKALGVAPFTVRPLLAQAGRFNWENLKRMYDELLRIDERMKTGGMELSVEDQRALELALERFLVGVAQ